MGPGTRAAAIVLLAIAGCASTPQASVERDAEAKQFAAQPGAATLYVYRPESSISWETENDPVLYVDGRLIGATRPLTYFRVDVRPGAHVLHGIGPDQGSLSLDTRPGEVYFISLSIVGGHSYFERVGAEDGKRAIRGCCDLMENWAPGQRPLYR